MSPDDLIAAFAELAATDPDMRIDRNKVGDLDEIRLAAGWDVQNIPRFEALATDAVALFAPVGDDDEVTRWLWIVKRQAPELVEPVPGCKGHAIVDGKRVEMVTETIHHAASASVLVVRRLRDAQRRRDQQTPPPVHPVDPGVLAAVQEVCPTAENDGLADLRGLATESGHLFDALDPVRSVVVYVPMRASDELGNAAHLFETDDKGIPRFMRLGRDDRRIVLSAYSPVAWIENHRFAPHQLRFYLVGADQRGTEDARRRAQLFDELAERCCAAACPTEDAPAGPSEPPSYPAFEIYRAARWTYWLHVHAWRRVIGSLVAPRQTALIGTAQRFGPAWMPVETSIASGNAEPTKAGKLELERGWFSHLTTDVFEATRLVLERVIGNIERRSEKAERVQAGRAVTAAMAGGVMRQTPQPGEATKYDDLVTLDQAAAVVNQSKRTLERYLQHGKLPVPDVPGGGGRAHRWCWSTLRPVLEEHFRPDLPTKFPASRLV